MNANVTVHSVRGTGGHSMDGSYYLAEVVAGDTTQISWQCSPADAPRIGQTVHVEWEVLA